MQCAYCMFNGHLENRMKNNTMAMGGEQFPPERLGSDWRWTRNWGRCCEHNHTHLFALKWNYFLGKPRREVISAIIFLWFSTLKGDKFEPGWVRWPCSEQSDLLPLKKSQKGFWWFFVSFHVAHKVVSKLRARGKNLGTNSTSCSAILPWCNYMMF